MRLRIGLKVGRRFSVLHKFSFVSVCIPLKSAFPGQRGLLLSLVEQNHPDFEVVFILENEHDGAKSVVDDICREFSHCRTVISGPASTCAQKNCSLIAGLRSLPPHTEIVVFCDGNSRAAPDWLVSMTEPIEMNRFEAVTTFRAFHPDPPTVSGVCHAVYASFITLSKTFFPKPWGGGTAVRRETLDALDMIDLWGRTVVDDMVLGNALDRAGIKVKMDGAHLLVTPLKDTSFKGFMDYLGRQVLFPKFTNPGIWLAGLVLAINTTLVFLAGVVLLISSVTALHFSPAACVVVVFWAIVLLLAYGCRWGTPVSLPYGPWLISVFLTVFLGTWLCVRSIFQKAVVWQGRIYEACREGVVLNVECEEE